MWNNLETSKYNKPFLFHMPNMHVDINKYKSIQLIHGTVTLANPGLPPHQLIRNYCGYYTYTAVSHIHAYMQAYWEWTWCYFFQFVKHVVTLMLFKCLKNCLCSLHTYMRKLKGLYISFQTFLVLLVADVIKCSKDRKLRGLSEFCSVY